MSSGQILLHPHVWPFCVPLGLFLLVSLLEIIVVFTGFGADAGLDLSADIDVPEASSHGWVLDWLGLGRVPFLISLAAFLLVLGLIGVTVQSVMLGSFGFALPWPLVMTGSVLGSLPVVRTINLCLGRIWPKDVETSATSVESYVGHEAEVVLGGIGGEEPGQIKFRDSAGAMHHVMAYADKADETYTAGEAVLIVGRRGAFFTVIRHPNPSRPRPA